MHMFNKVVACFSIVCALAVAGDGNTYRVSLYQPTVVNGTTFKPGECKLELKDHTIVFKQGKNTAEATVQVENGPNKFDSTSVGYSDGRVQEIRLGGTNTKL